MSERQDLEELERRLERLTAAMRLPESAQQAKPAQAEGKGSSILRGFAAGGIAFALALIATSIALGQPLLLIPALLLGALSAVVMIRGVSELLVGPVDPTRARIGMGASVGTDAIVEPGATVEMGADVGQGAVIKRGAVVRSGASVHEGATVEEDAVVSWGADVMQGARVGRKAIVGAGATVHEGAEVPAGTRLLPGSDWARAKVGETRAATLPSAPAADPREARFNAICDRIERELEQSPENVRAFLGASNETVRALRETCLGLISRERSLRAESSEESLAFLEKERSELESRAVASNDERVRSSLQSAVAAIDEQVRQRAALRISAERIAADLTRLEWTLDGMGAQLVRLRTAGAHPVGDPTAEVVGTVRKLNEEIEALAQAMEEVSGVAPVDEAVSTDAVTRNREAQRTR